MGMFDVCFYFGAKTLFQLKPVQNTLHGRLNKHRGFVWVRSYRCLNDAYIVCEFDFCFGP